jgi:hypothetical protein
VNEKKGTNGKKEKVDKREREREMQKGLRDRKKIY